MPTKVCLVKAMVFPVVMGGCEGWTIKNVKVKEKSETIGLKLKANSKNKDLGIWSHHFMANGWGNNGNSDKL